MLFIQSMGKTLMWKQPTNHIAVFFIDELSHWLIATHAIVVWHLMNQTCAVSNRLASYNKIKQMLVIL